MSPEEHRHGMDEFNQRLTRVETRQESIQAEVVEFKDEFRDHDRVERDDRKDIIQKQDRHTQCLQEIKRELASSKGFFKGLKMGIVIVLMFAGGLIATALHKLVGF